jgi:hypothetical protein
VLGRPKANLALARHHLRRIEQSLIVWPADTGNGR